MRRERELVPCPVRELVSVRRPHWWCAMTADLSTTARLDVPLAEVTTLVERLRCGLPLDDPDRHDLDPLDDAFAHLAPGYPVSAVSA